MPQLESFNIQTGVNWKFESGVFDNIVNLKYLTIHSYVPNKIPRDVLRRLDLDVLRLTLQSSSLPLSSICSQQHLRQLNLGSNNLRALDLPSCFTHLTMLSALLMRRNKLTSLRQTDFGVLNNSQLKQLSVSDCAIYSVHEETFQPLVHIQSIHLDENRISHLPHNIFHNLRNLTMLNLAN